MYFKARMHAAAALDSSVRTLAQDASELEYADTRSLINWLQRRAEDYGVQNARTEYKHAAVSLYSGSSKLVTFAQIS